MKLNHLMVLGLLLLFAGCDQLSTENTPARNAGYQPWESLGPLFDEVQFSALFRDSKTFVDCIPKRDPSAIRNEYLSQRQQPDFDLMSFVESNFIIPAENPGGEFVSEKSFEEHLNTHWNYLIRSDKDQDAFSTLISLPEPYVVPGGRFREIYYWDSYFTMIGLVASGKLELVRQMLDNFRFLIEEYGFVPNGNRLYYLSRSQPPFFSSMLELYMAATSEDAGLKYLPALQKEYDFWMNGAEKLTDSLPAYQRVVKYDKVVLNRYWDQLETPRPESYLEDTELAEGMAPDEKRELYRNLRAGAESGWDYSSRWFGNSEDFRTIRIVDIVPVDLNCLLYGMETTLWRLYQISDQEENYRKYLKKAENRYNAINDLFWNPEAAMYQDLLWEEGTHSERVTAAGFYPLYFKVARQDLADEMIPVLLDHLLSNGGVRTTMISSGQQWDHPNGWAPLQWIAIKGLQSYRHPNEANEIRNRWLKTNQKIYLNTGRMMEKYNVDDTTLLAGGGEYPTQDGFGWTNGVALGLLSEGNN